MTIIAQPVSPKLPCPRHDARLALAIDGHLARAGAADARHVGIVVWEGAVTLLGSVESEAARDRVAAAIAAMPGVLGVQDRLRVRAHQALKFPDELSIAAAFPPPSPLRGGTGWG